MSDTEISFARHPIGCSQVRSSRLTWNPGCSVQRASNFSSYTLELTFLLSINSPNIQWSSFSIGPLLQMFFCFNITRSAFVACPYCTSSKVTYSGTGWCFWLCHFLCLSCALPNISWISCQISSQSWTNISLLGWIPWLSDTAPDQLVSNVKP